MKLDFGALNKDSGVETPVPAVRDPFDIKPIEKLFDKFIVEIAGMETVAAEHVVSDDMSCNNANTMTNQAKKLAQVIEKKRKDVKEPYLKVSATIDGFAGGLRKRLATIQAGLSKKILPYMQKMEQKRQEEIRKAAEEARKEQERLENIRLAEAARQAELARQKAIEQGRADEEAERFAREAAEAVEPAPQVVIPLPVTPEVIETEAGTSKLATKVQGFVVNFKLLPDECIKARWGEIEKAVMPWIRAQIAAGLRDIPGVEIKQVVKLETRTRR